MPIHVSGHSSQAFAFFHSMCQLLAVCWWDHWSQPVCHLLSQDIHIHSYADEISSPLCSEGQRNFLGPLWPYYELNCNHLDWYTVCFYAGTALPVFPLLLNVATDRLDSVCNILDVISLLVFVDLPFPSSLDRGFQCVWLEKVVQNLFFFPFLSQTERR